MAPPTEYPGYFDATSLLNVICAALASYNACELILLIFTTFNAYHGLYFWSMVTATVAIIPYVTGMEVAFFDPSARLPALIINNLGWICMVVAQSFVLYSRLGIVLGTKTSKILTFTKWMIIINGFVFYTLATVIVFGMHYSTDPNFDKGYIYVERLQMTGFCIQEFIISGLYIWKTLDILQAGEKQQARRTLWQIFIINIVIVALDIALLVLEYLSFSSIQIAFKALAYSVKLKMEFAILSKLVESSSLTQRNVSLSFTNTIALDEDPKNYGAPSNSTPRFLTSSLSPWSDDKEKVEHVGRIEHRSHETTRSTSHQTSDSEAYLFGANSATLRSVSTLRTDVHDYHDLIRSISHGKA